VLFGCGHSQSDNFFFGADGVLGLGRSLLSLPSQLQNIYPDIFSYWLLLFGSSRTNMKIHLHLVEFFQILNYNFNAGRPYLRKKIKQDMRLYKVIIFLFFLLLGVWTSSFFYYLTFFMVWVTIQSFVNLQAIV
jgi:hypothetical protein